MTKDFVITSLAILLTFTSATAMPMDTTAKGTTGSETKNGDSLLKSIDPYAGFSIGANFDLIDGVSPNSAYVIANVGSRGLFGRLGVVSFGFESLLYRNRTSSGTDSSTSLSTSYSPFVGSSDSLIENSTTSTQSLRKVIDNFGVGSFASISIKPTDQSYVALIPLGFEFRRQYLSYESVNVTTSGTSQIVSTADVRSSDPSTVKPKPDSAVNQWWYYVGGLEVCYETESFSCRTLGFPYVIRKADGAQEDIAYMYRFFLVENSLGIELGGEIRGVYNQPGNEYIIYLGKRFNFKKLADFLK